MSARGCQGHVLKTAGGSSRLAAAVFTRDIRSACPRRTSSLYAPGAKRRNLNP
jgi:hypothetical protein